MSVELETWLLEWKAPHTWVRRVGSESRLWLPPCTLHGGRGWRDSDTREVGSCTVTRQGPSPGHTRVLCSGGRSGKDPQEPVLTLREDTWVQTPGVGGSPAHSSAGQAVVLIHDIS